MSLINLDKLRQTPVNTQPYSYLVVPGFIAAETVKRVNATFPEIEKGGSYPVENLTSQMTIGDIIEEMDGPEFEKIIAEKFGVGLKDRPKMFSLRGHTRAKDGSIHTDSKDKIITVLLYLNDNWTQNGGRLRILRNGTEMDNYAAEVAPDNGTLLIFKRSDSSWHGHPPFEGQRRSLQMNWMTDTGKRKLHVVRHKISNVLKRVTVNLSR
jgi:SM-20-related protein